jgi:peptidoglycan/xylan/chitin deacetylase (PgdA/CDA1 family)
MKRLSIGAMLALVALAACQTALTQSESSAAPQQEATREAAPATAGSSAEPSASPAVGTAQGAAYVTAAKAQPPAVAIPKHSYTSCDVNGPYIAMTFDDGPSEELTPKLMDIMKERGIKATFYLAGQNTTEYQNILRRMASKVTRWQTIAGAIPR